MKENASVTWGSIRENSKHLENDICSTITEVKAIIDVIGMTGVHGKERKAHQSTVVISLCFSWGNRSKHLPTPAAHRKPHVRLQCQCGSGGEDHTHDHTYWWVHTARFMSSGDGTVNLVDKWGEEDAHTLSLWLTASCCQEKHCSQAQFKDSHRIHTRHSFIGTVHEGISRITSQSYGITGPEEETGNSNLKDN